MFQVKSGLEFGLKRLKKNYATLEGIYNSLAVLTRVSFWIKPPILKNIQKWSDTARSTTEETLVDRPYIMTSSRVYSLL